MRCAVNRQKYLLLVIGFLRRLLEIHLELVEEGRARAGAGPPRPRLADRLRLALRRARIPELAPLAVLVLAE